MNIKPGDKPLCAEYDPELWFPDATSLRTHSDNDRQEFVDKAIFAIRTCQRCLLFADNKCIEYAMDDAATIDHGIYAASLPFERRKAVGLRPEDSNKWEFIVRKAADDEGILPTYIAKRERPNQLHVTYFSRTKNTFTDDEQSGLAS